MTRPTACDRAAGVPLVGRDAATLLRHRPPAVLLGTIAWFDGSTLACSGRGDGPWRWGQLLEGAAQVAGLLAGLQAGGPDATAVIAELRDAVVHAATHAGPVRFSATFERRVLGFWRCRAEAHTADGRLLVAARVSVAARIAAPGGGGQEA